jgi:hypothetical protein
LGIGHRKEMMDLRNDKAIKHAELQNRIRKSSCRKRNS